MARIRNIKPEFWTDEKLVELEPWERLLFIGLWSFADDAGYMAYSPKRIKMQVFPGDSLEVSRGLASLLRMGALALYSVGDDPEPQVLSIVNWGRHQRPAHPTPSKWEGADLRVCTIDPPASRELVSPRETSVRKGKGEGEGKGDGKRDEQTRSTDAVTGAVEPVTTSFDEFWAVYPNRQGKVDARKAWGTAKCARIAEQVIAGAVRYRDDPNRDPAFTKLPAGWLRDGRWDDDPLPPRSGQSKQQTEQAATDDFFERAMRRAQDAEAAQLALHDRSSA